MLGWIKIGVEFIKALAGQWKGSPNASSETANTMAEETPGADSVAVGDESQISIKTGASPNQQEIERRREVVRQLFNDFWVSAEDKPGTFSVRARQERVQPTRKSCWISSQDPISPWPRSKASG